ncbi:hypothetical protein AMTRI_Chr05g59740 [Amborella trichopoda]
MISYRCPVVLVPHPRPVTPHLFFASSLPLSQHLTSLSSSAKISILAPCPLRLQPRPTPSPPLILLSHPPSPPVIHRTPPGLSYHSSFPLPPISAQPPSSRACPLNPSLFFPPTPYFFTGAPSISSTATVPPLMYLSLPLLSISPTASFSIH